MKDLQRYSGSANAPEKEHAVRVNGLLQRLCGAGKKFNFLVIKQILVDRQMAAWIPALSGRKCGWKSHDYSN